MITQDTIRDEINVLIVDDIIANLTVLAEMIKKAGAKEVHVRISSPPVVETCYLGMDTPNEKHLIGASSTKETICRTIGADSLEHISLEGLIEASGGRDSGFCSGCFNGNYPIEKEDE